MKSITILIPVLTDYIFIYCYQALSSLAPRPGEDASVIRGVIFCPGGSRPFDLESREFC